MSTNTGAVHVWSSALFNPAPRPAVNAFSTPEAAALPNDLGDTCESDGLGCLTRSTPPWSMVSAPIPANYY